MKTQITKKILMMATVGLLAFATYSVQAQQFQPGSVEAGQLSDAMAQTAGSFDTMNMSYISSMGMQQKAWNDPMQHLGEGQTKPGYSRYVWTPDVVLPIRLREGMMTMINLPAWELIEKVHIGSPESFGGEIAAPNSLLLYADPTYLGVDSNMIIFGRSGNRYVFYLRSETYNTDRITNAVVDVLVGPRYTPVSVGGQLGDQNGASVSAAGVVGGGRAGAPGWSSASGSLTPGGAQSPNPGLNTAGNAPKDWLESIPVDPEKFRFDIDVYVPNPSDIDLAPERVWRDDIFTYIDFGTKALTMTQRPVVNLIVQDSEVPVGSRTRGPHSRLLVVEGVGDMILRNGQRIVCLKMRRDPAMGLENTDYSWSKQNTWYADQPSKQADMNSVQGFNPYDNAYAANMQPMPNGVMQSAAASQGIVDVMVAMPYAEQTARMSKPVIVDNIAIELASATSVAELEAKWQEIQSKNRKALSGYSPYYSMDAIAEGGLPELFRLRVGPFGSVKDADNMCDTLGKKGVSCSVVRTE